MLIEAEFLIEIFVESIVLIFHKRADVVLTRNYIKIEADFLADIRRKHCPDLS